MSTAKKRDQILSRLSNIESQESVRILYACESGSRAWGFASTDSDYDVRFFYARPRDWYLSIDFERQRDVIELPISDDLDITGWDVRKTLQLYRRSNPPLYEKLFSPIVYVEQGWFAERLRSLAPRFYDSRAATYHYYNMASNTFKSHLRSEVVNRKKYLYALRPVLAVLWIERGLGVVPMELERLTEAIVEEPLLQAEIQELLREKRGGSELDTSPPYEAIHGFLESELERLGRELKNFAVPQGDTEILNELFRSLITENMSK